MEVIASVDQLHTKLQRARVYNACTHVGLRDTWLVPVMTAVAKGLNTNNESRTSVTARNNLTNTFLMKTI